jgi:hypothetical protein
VRSRRDRQPSVKFSDMTTNDGSGGRHAKRLVTVTFQYCGEFRTARSNNAPFAHHMNHRGREFLQQSTKVRDRENAARPFFGRVGEAPRHRTECINVKSRVNFVEQREFWTKNSELHNFGSLSFTTGQINIDESVQHVRTQLNSLCFVAHTTTKVARIRTRGAEQIKWTNPRHFEGLLHRK